MASRRKDELSDKLVGWRDQIAPRPTVTNSASAKAGEYIRKTYLLTPEQIRRVNRLADDNKVGRNELVRYMLDFALNQIESGAHQLPVEPVKSNRIGG